VTTAVVATAVVVVVVVVVGTAVVVVVVVVGTTVVVVVVVVGTTVVVVVVGTVVVVVVVVVGGSAVVTTAPVVPVVSTTPVVPVVRRMPVVPVVSGVPVVPVVRTTPVVPVVSSAPVVPVVCTTPVVPVVSTTPVVPVVLGVPVVPVVSRNPVVPVVFGPVSFTGHTSVILLHAVLRKNCVSNVRRGSSPFVLLPSSGPHRKLPNRSQKNLVVSFKHVCSTTVTFSVPDVDTFCVALYVHTAQHAPLDVGHSASLHVVSFRGVPSCARHCSGGSSMHVSLTQHARSSAPVVGPPVVTGPDVVPVVT
jgi:hypothetical protein